MKILILGTRGIPAQHGGFETFAESLSLFLVEQGHEVTVYCQTTTLPTVREDIWKGVQRVHIQAPNGPKGTIKFDWLCTLDALSKSGLPLVLGYNTAIFSALFRLRGRLSLMNMDGLEWKREKWSALQRLWLRFNEFAGAKLSTHLIADHPEIGRHLEMYVPSSKITVIAYGADAVTTEQSRSARWLSEKARLGLDTSLYALVVARLEPENSILEIVQAFSRKTRKQKLVVLGNLTPSSNRYHRRVLEAAGSDIIFPGAIYEKEVVRNLRADATLYFHGHRVGGTNPSLVEAMAAGSAVVAHDNVFTRWVAGPSARYFCGTEDLAALLDQLLDDYSALDDLRRESRRRHQEAFTQQAILGRYAHVLQSFSSRLESAQVLDRLSPEPQ